MQEINETDFLSELLYCINESDVIKAQALLQFFPQVSPPFQNRILYEISMTSTDLAARLLSFIATLAIHEEMVREKLYEVILDKAHQDPRIITGLINEGRPENRRIVVKVVGDMKFAPAAPEIIKILKTSTDIMLLKDCIKVMSKIGDDACVPVIADFIFYDDPELKNMAVFALGELRSAESLEALKKVSRTQKVDRHVLDTIAAHIDALETHLAAEKTVVEKKPAQREKELTPPERLKQMLVSDDFGKRHAAMDQLASLGTERLDELSSFLDQGDTDLKVNTLKILDNIGGETTVNIIRKALYHKTDNPLIRFAIYDTIAHFPYLTSAISIIEGIDAQEEIVRMASAAAMNRHLSDLHIAGLKTRVESGGMTSRKIVGAILDSRSHRIFEALAASDAFIHNAADHLNRQAHPEVKNYFLELLKKSGKSALARTIDSKPAEVKRKNRKVVFIVHYSRVILDYLNKILYNAGFLPCTFSSPEQALSRLSSIKPDLLVTAVFLDGIDGISFSDRFRMLFQNGAPETIFISTNNLEGMKIPETGTFIQLPLAEPDFIQTAEKAVSEKSVSTGGTLSYGNLNKLLTSEWLCLRAAAINLMSNLGTGISPLLRMNFKSGEEHLIISSLKVAEKIWDSSLTPEITALAKTSKDSPGVRFYAFEALGILSMEKADFTLADILGEEVYSVRLSANRLLDRWMDDRTAMELKDMVEIPGEQSRRIVADVIASFAVNTFNRLMRTDTFAHLAMYHLARNVHESTRDFYLDLLRSQGLKSMARSIQQDVVPQEELDDYPLFIITGSRIRQSILTSLLNGLGAPLLSFESWDEAMEMFDISTPLGIITDLSLNSSTCLGYLKTIAREKGPDRIFVAVISDLKEFQGAPRLLDPDRIIESFGNSYGIDSVFYLPVDMPGLKKAVQGKIRKITQLPA